jgi:hypothetical protein
MDGDGPTQNLGDIKVLTHHCDLVLEVGVTHPKVEANFTDGSIWMGA